MELWTALASVTPDLTLYRVTFWAFLILGAAVLFRMQGHATGVVCAAAICLVGTVGAAPALADRAHEAVAEQRRTLIAEHLTHEHDVTVTDPVALTDGGATTRGVTADGDAVTVTLTWFALESGPRSPATRVPSGAEPLTITVTPSLARAADPQTRNSPGSN